MWSVNSGAGNAASPLLTWQRHKSAHRKWLFINYRIPIPTTTTTTCFLGSRPSPSCRGLARWLGARRRPGPARPGSARPVRCAAAALGGSRFSAFRGTGGGGSRGGSRCRRCPLPPPPFLPVFQERESLPKRWGAGCPARPLLGGDSRRHQVAFVWSSLLGLPPA